jgi:thiol-disulfide isomerase/thioredoxin
MLSSMHPLLVCLFGGLSLVQAPAPAQENGWVGKPAPALEIDAWLNHGDRPRPSLENLRGRVVLLEFWGTCKKDCMKMEPLAQVLHEKYRDAGLEVLVISYDSADVLRDLITKRSLSVPMGSTGMGTYRTWGIPQVPTACVLDPQGAILYHGFPDEVEPAIQAALGAEVDVGLLLGRWLEGGEGVRETLARLSTLSPRSFDLRRWAGTLTGRACDPQADPPTPAEPCTPLAAGEWLTRSVTERRAGHADASRAALARLAATAPEDFDLRTWARKTQGKVFPLTRDELVALLAERSYERVLDAFCHRCTTPALAELALADEGLRAHCRKRIPEARAFAKKGLMAEHWLFGGLRPRRKQLYWIDMGVAFQTHAQDGSAQITIGAELVNERTVDSFVTDNLEYVLVASSFAARRAPPHEALPARVTLERAELRAYLLERYGVR